MNSANEHGGWDVHMHIVPAPLVAAAETGRYGMQKLGMSLKICGHGVPLHPISEIGKLVDRMQSDHLDGAIVSVPPPLFRPDLGDDDRRSYAALINDSLLTVCQSAHRSLRPFAYLPAESPELCAEIASGLDRQWAGVEMERNWERSLMHRCVSTRSGTRSATSSFPCLFIRVRAQTNGSSRFT